MNWRDVWDRYWIGIVLGVMFCAWLACAGCCAISGVIHPS